jgi:hypothetical protein
MTDQPRPPAAVLCRVCAEQFHPPGQPCCPDCERLDAAEKREPG